MIHIYPHNDWIDHDVTSESGECHFRCEPTIEYVDSDTGTPHSEPLVIHNAIDQREKTESCDPSEH